MGVSVVVAAFEGRRAGLTISTLVSLSLSPPLVAISLARAASLYEVLRASGRWGISILAGDQERLAQHFARNAPPLVQWEGIDVRADDPLLLEGAVGWMSVQTETEHPAGDHSLFVGAIASVERGPGQGALVYYDRRYQAL
jgi:flavin reductase (DIM6/NTAB) family NADH-FMN oxidoreductase RutF